ncbi:MAG: hypothetical protein KBI08_12930, partial [Sphingobium sp.]|nr:hypothetical protein [Sphingobium sp.]
MNNSIFTTNYIFVWSKAREANKSICSLLTKVKWGASVVALALSACASPSSKNHSLELHSYELGAKAQVILRAPKANGADPVPYSVVFEKDELRRFLEVEHLPLSEKAMQLLDKESCRLGLGHKPFSLGIEAGTDHAVRQMEKQQSAGDYYRRSNSPAIKYGFLDKGEPKWLGGGREAVHDLFSIDEDRPFGMLIRCGYNSDREQLVNCTVKRDVNRVVSVQYNICSNMLIYLKEIDSLYFDFIKKIVVKPN